MNLLFNIRDISPSHTDQKFPGSFIINGAFNLLGRFNSPVILMIKEYSHVLMQEKPAYLVEIDLRAWRVEMYRDISAAELGTIAASEAIRRAGIAPDQIDASIFGTARQAGNGPNPARLMALKGGLPKSAPADDPYDLAWHNHSKE